MNDFYVYCWEGPTGKKYVGKGRGQRARRHIQYALEARRNDSPTFYSAIRKYGPEAFKLTYLSVNISESQAFEIEREFIRDWGTMSPNGYNLTSGGEGAVPSSEARARMSAAKKNMSLETRARMSAAKRGRRQSLTHIANRVVTQRKISVAEQQTVMMLTVLGASAYSISKWFDVARFTIYRIRNSHGLFVRP